MTQLAMFIAFQESNRLCNGETLTMGWPSELHKKGLVHNQLMEGIGTDLQLV